MTSLEANQNYLFKLDQAFPPTNISFTGTFYEFLPNNYLILQHQMSQKPDRVQLDNNFCTSGVEVNQTLTSNNNCGDWNWNNNTKILSYILSNKINKQPFLDLALNFNAYKCRWAGTINLKSIKNI